MRSGLMFSSRSACTQEMTAMNRWQIFFLVFGVVAIIAVAVFPPQFVTSSMVRFQYFGEGYPIDWLRLFLWVVGIVFIAGLGFAVNKQEHS